LILTEGSAAVAAVLPAIEQFFVSITPLARPGSVDEVAKPVAFLASDDARYITGETLYVSGGAGI
jgi:3-oxoacyl-[acyl-carrier protein] reductase